MLQNPSRYFQATVFIVFAQNVPTGLGLFDRRSSPPPQNQSVQVRHAFFHAPKRSKTQHGLRHPVRGLRVFSRSVNGK